MASEFWKKSFNMKFQESNEQLVVSKDSNSDWSYINRTTNDCSNGEIVIKSRAMAEQLHFTLGLLLKEG